MLDHVDLVELDDLFDPELAHDESTFAANSLDLSLEGVKVDGDVVDAWEDVGQKTSMMPT